MVNVSVMTPAKMRKFTAVVLDTELDPTLRLFARLGVVHFVDIKNRAKEFGAPLNPVEASPRFYHLSNLLTRVTTLITGMKVPRGGKAKSKDRQEVPEVPDETYLTALETKVKVVEDGFDELSRNLKAAQALPKKKERKAARKEVKKAIKALAAERRTQLLAWEELLQREHALEKTKTLFGKTQRTYVLAGWIPAKRAKRFTRIISEETHNAVALEITKYHEPKHHKEQAGGAAETEPHETPPTKLTNPGFLGPYEKLTTAFGVPNHRELDPTFFLAICFPIFFGLMFGDVGHGMLLFGFALLGMIANRRGVDLGELGNYFLKGAGLIATSAVFSMFFGLLYGEFFGFSIVQLQLYQDIRRSPFGLIMRGFLINLYRFFDFDAGLHFFQVGEGTLTHDSAIWFSAFESTEATWLLFVTSIIIGVIHLSIAITLDLINKVRRHEWKHAVLGPLVWLWFFFGLATLIFTKGINFNLWFTWNDPLQPNIFGTAMADVLILFIGPLIAMIGGGMIASGFMAGFMEGLEHFIASISNTISYARILALSMAHAGFGKTFLIMAGIEDPIWGVIPANLITFLLVMMIGTIFILLMEGLLTFIHSLRLHWVEAYLKFYAGDGYMYQPLTIPNKWTTSPAASKR